MPSPLDVKVLRGLKNRGFEIVSIIHDATTHPGEIWPRHRDILTIIKHSNYVVTLSEYVKNQLRNKFNVETQVISVRHPVFPFGLKIVDVLSEKDYFLFVGRIKRYKGVQLLLQSWRLSNIGDAMLVIAGEGSIPPSFLNLPTIKIVNRWLTEAEIANLISKAKVVVFPYLESSQSGLLPLAINLKKIVLISDLPGLIEQTKGYEKTFIFESGSIVSLTTSLKEISQVNDTVNENEAISKSIDEDWINLDKALKFTFFKKTERE